MTESKSRTSWPTMQLGSDYLCCNSLSEEGMFLFSFSLGYIMATCEEVHQPQYIEHMESELEKYVKQFLDQFILPKNKGK